MVDRFHAFAAELLGVLSNCMAFTIIDIGGIASKMITITKFEVEKFNGKSNFLLWKMRVTTLLVKEGTHKALLGAEKKSSKMEDYDIDFRTKTTIILCL